jgi:hypothetical protein
MDLPTRKKEMKNAIDWQGVFGQMLERFEQSFLTTKTWTIVRKKIARSQRTWVEGKT